MLTPDSRGSPSAPCSAARQPRVAAGRPPAVAPWLGLGYGSGVRVGLGLGLGLELGLGSGLGLRSGLELVRQPARLAKHVAHVVVSLAKPGRDDTRLHEQIAIVSS